MSTAMAITTDNRMITVTTLPEYPGYAVTTSGEVYSCVKSSGKSFYPKWHKLKPMKTGSRRQYLTVYLGFGNRWDIHRLIAFAFLGPCPSGCEVRHLNGIPSDNRLENLSYGTHSQNMQDAIRHGTAPRGEKNPSAILSKSSVREIRRLREEGLKLRSIAKHFSVSVETVSQIARGVRWGWLN